MKTQNKSQPNMFWPISKQSWTLADIRLAVISFLGSKRGVVPHRLERICSGLNNSGVSKAKMESLSWMTSRSSSSSQNER